MNEEKNIVVTENQQTRKISQKELEEISQNKKKKLVKEGDNEYKVLNKLHG